MKLQGVVNVLLIIGLVLTLIVVGKDFLVPIILAVVLWYLINAVNNFIRLVPLIKANVKNSITLIVSAIGILTIIVSTGSLIGQTINNMIVTAPNYQVNLEQQLSRLLNAVGYSQDVTLKSMTAELDINGFLKNLLTSFSSMAQRFFLVLLYTLFLLIEQHTFKYKIAALRWDSDRKEKVGSLLGNINNAVRTYIGVKFAASIATALLSLVVIKYAGLDYALFWAFLIFVFNFIPTIGSIVATIFPSLIALIQFDHLSPFVIVLTGVGLIQLCIGGVLEPKLYGDSLNISPFVIVINLVLWGILWGIVGMLLCVPIMVILIKVFAQFPKTRPVAVLLSQTGRI